MSDAGRHEEQFTAALHAICGEGVGTLEAKGFRPVALIFLVLLEGNVAHEVGIAKSGEGQQFIDELKAVFDLAQMVKSSPRRQAAFDHALAEALKTSEEEGS